MKHMHRTSLNSSVLKFWKSDHFWNVSWQFSERVQKPPFFQDGGLCTERILADFQYVIEDIEFYRSCEFRFTINFFRVKTYIDWTKSRIVTKFKGSYVNFYNTFSDQTFSLAATFQSYFYLNILQFRCV